ncbi:unnamed protein product [Arabis nemorensis]|uniref:DUF3444 domain-containing protein n=1 Tax=Arabis nemorensis TaxID=586526 RepID=A0A565CQP6_9BRAS|nr:unnamed protein product [Arabis nemorensis]
MVEPEYSLFPGGDKPEQKQPPASNEEDKSPERVYGLDRVVMKGNSEKIVEEIEERASSILRFSLEREKIEEEFDKMRVSLEIKEERLRVVEVKEKETGLLEESISEKQRVLQEKETESDLRQVIEATLMRLVIEKRSEEAVTQLETQENNLCLLRHSMTKALEDMVSEFAGKKEEAGLLFESIDDKLCELDKAEKNFDLKQSVEIERRNEESKQLEAKKTALSLLEESISDKSAELKRKEETFELKLKEEADKWREETEMKSKDLEIMVKTLEKRLKEVKLKQMEFEEEPTHQVIDEVTRKRSNLEFEPPLLVKNNSDAGSLTRLAKRHKSHEEEQVACALHGTTDPKSEDICEAYDGEIKGIDKSDFSNSMSSFAVDQVWAVYDTRDDMPRIYAQIRGIFNAQLSLQVTLLEHVKTTKDERSIPVACGRFEYGDTEIKSHLMFAHEMQYIKCGKDIIVNPRKGETWALFRDWNTSHSDIHEPPYRYDFVEVISDFDDRLGIAVAYMGRVEGFLSVFNHAEQHGLIKMMISPEEMQRFSHKVASVKLSGEEKAGSFVLNPAAAPSYHPLLEEGQDGSTKDLPIIID